MAYIQTVAETEASGTLREIYEGDLTGEGYIPNYNRAMSLHPEAITAWRQLVKAIRSKMRLRRYELVTYAAALALRCRY